MHVTTNFGIHLAGRKGKSREIVSIASCARGDEGMRMELEGIQDHGAIDTAMVLKEAFICHPSMRESSHSGGSIRQDGRKYVPR